MSRKSALSRRAFLRGSGGIMVGLPFLEAMIPIAARAQGAQAKRFIVAFNGSVNGNNTYAVPSSIGPISSLAGLGSWKALESVKQHITLITNQTIPTHTHASGGAFIPGGSQTGQHGYTRGPILSGMGSYEAMQIPQACKTATQPGNQTCDQYAADIFGAGLKFRSLELKVQAVPYNGKTSATNGSMAARKQNGVVSALLPKVSPLQIFDDLFSGILGGPTGPTPSAQLLRDKSVLDLILEDATRLNSMLSGDDKQRMELHFEEIRSVERRISSAINGSGTGGGGNTCTKPTRPGADTPPNSMNAGGWANETLRGQIQAELIAYAIACDLTRVVTWMISHDQCFMNSQNTSGSSVTPNGGGVPEVHSDSHSAGANIVAANCNWHADLFGRLIGLLASRSDAGGPLLDNTFAALISAEGAAAHARVGMVTVVAGNRSKINNGVHINAGGAHPARTIITGLQSVGVNMNDTMGQVSGTIAGLAK